MNYKFIGCIILILFMSITNFTYASSSDVLTVKEFTQTLKVLDKENRLDIESTSDIPLTRQKAAAIIVKLMGYEGIVKDYKDSTVFKDVTEYKGEINLVKQLGIMSGLSETSFNPLGTVSKEQGRVILNRLQDKLNTSTQWNHAFYALSSSSQMDLIPSYDAISFGWAQVGYDSLEGRFKIREY